MRVRQAMLFVFAAVFGLLVVAGAGARSDPYGSVTRLAGGTGSSYGLRLALSGDAATAILGDPGRPKGAAWVSRRAIGGAWSTLVRLPGGDGFGRAVALSADGRTAVIGAPFVDDQSGGVWVYANRGGGVWAGQRLRPSGLHAHYHEQFGDSVAISANGSTILVGAPALGAQDTGAVWAFARTGSAWKQQGGMMLPKSAVGGAKFGATLALSADGDFALAGGPNDNGGRGAVWALHRASGRWSQQKLAPTFLAPNDHFGAVIALPNDAHVALVSDHGHVEILTRAGTTWTRRTYLFEVDAVGYGGALALSGDGQTAFIGGGLKDTAPSLPKVATWVLRRGASPTTWNQIGRIFDLGTTSASSNGEVVLIGGSVYALGPSIGGVAPAIGSTAGGTTVTITGHDFKDIRWVLFGSQRAPSFHVDSPTQLTVVTPPGQAGQVRVVAVTTNTVSSDEGTWSYYGTFTYVDRPAVTAVSPASGPTTGGTTVTITGRNFGDATGVKFGGNAADSFKVDSATQITAVSPPGVAGAVDVTVTTAGGTSTTSAADAFTYIATVVEKVITFDDLVTGGPGGAGSLVSVTSQYGPQGVTFNGPSAIDYSKGSGAIPDFARSGTVAIEQCVGVEFCTTPILGTFDPVQKRVRVWIGFSFRLDSPLTIQLKALDGSGGTVGTASATLPANSSPTPIRTPIEVQADSDVIKSFQVSVPGGYMNAVAVDSVTFSR